MTTPDDWDLPSHFSNSARDVFVEVIEERDGELGGADLGALEQAANLITAADALDEVAREAGYVAHGSMGQVTAHPAVVESRLARTAAATILQRLSPTREQRGRERARGAAAARWKK